MKITKQQLQRLVKEAYDDINEGQESKWTIKHKDSEGKEVTLTVYCDDCGDDSRKRRKAEAKARRKYDAMQKRKGSGGPKKRERIKIDENSKDAKTMKITKQQLKKIVKEEFEAVLAEDEWDDYDDPGEVQCPNNQKEAMNVLAKVLVDLRGKNASEALEIVRNNCIKEGPSQKGPHAIAKFDNGIVAKIRGKVPVNKPAPRRKIKPGIPGGAPTTIPDYDSF